MTGARELEDECRVLTRLLVRRAPTSYVVGKYLEAHAILHTCTAHAPFDRLLIASARGGVVRARIADGYARLFAPRATLRHKLVLLLAILEVSPPFDEHLERKEVLRPPAALWTLLLAGATGVATAAAGVVLFGPLHLWDRLRRVSP